MILLFILGAFVAIGVVVALVCIVQGFDLLEMLPVYCPDEKKNVRSSYWGCYQGAEREKGKDEAAIKLPKITFEEIVIAGSSVYAKGKAVKSLRK